MNRFIYNSEVVCHSKMGKALFGSVAEKIVRKAECVVMVVPLDYARRGGGNSLIAEW